MINVYIDVFIIVQKVFILFLSTLNMKNSRTFSNVLENFQQQNTQELCCQPNKYDD